MKNYKQAGNIIEFTAPSGGVRSGEPLRIGSLVVVPVVNADQGERFNGYTEGVFELPKKGSDTFTEGQKAYWDNNNKEITTHEGGNTLCGAAIRKAADRAKVVEVKLNGIAS